MIKTTSNSILVALAALSVVLYVCGNDKWPCVNGSGPVVTELLPEAGFTAVHSAIEVTLYTIQRSVFEVKLVAQQNVLDKIKKGISGGELQIESDHCINNAEPVLIYITMPTVSALSISG